MSDLHKTLDALSNRLTRAVPPITPREHHWLNSDATFSYCYPCARKARAAELGIPEPPTDKAFYERTDAEQDAESDFVEGIDGGVWYSGECDGHAACETCGETLAYVLTDWGVRDELDGFEDGGFVKGSVNGETTYALDRVFMGLDYGAVDPELLKRAIRVARAALKAARL